MTYIKQFVAQLIGRHACNDPLAICNALDIEVLHVALPKHIRGFYTCQMDTKFVYLNADLSTPVRDIVCAHELGHALLHESYNSLFLLERTEFVVERFEREANLFAGYLLLGPLPKDDSTIYGLEIWDAAGQMGLDTALIEKCLGSLC